MHLDRGNFRIAVVDLQSKGVQVLSQGRQDESPSFAPNGATLIYATQDRGRGVLATVSVDGRVQQRLAASTRRRARAGVVAVPGEPVRQSTAQRLAGVVTGFVAEFRAIFAVIPTRLYRLQER